LLHRVRFGHMRNLIVSKRFPDAAYALKKNPGIGASDFEDENGVFKVDRALRVSGSRFLLILICRDESVGTLYSATLSEFLTLCEGFKCSDSVDFSGLSVVSISTVREVDTGTYLPIVVPDYIKQGYNRSMIPGRIVRELNNTELVLFPVQGFYNNKDVAYPHDNWEVRGSIVFLRNREKRKIKKLKEAGFYEIEHSNTKKNQIALGHHRLAQVSCSELEDEI